MNAMKSPYILALDVGTSSTRALLFDATGRAVPDLHSQSKYELKTTVQGEVSVDADTLVAIVARTIDEVLRESGPLAEQIGAVALDTFWHSLLGVDASGRPVTSVITWEDTRAFETARALRKELDEQATHARTGVHFHASYWPAKLRWLAQNQPQAFNKAVQWISFGEYLHRKFLGRSVCSLSMASGTGMLNFTQRTWDEELTYRLGLKPEQLPEIGDVHDGIIGLTTQYASAWPVLNHVPWFPAIGDGASACIGTNCITPAHWSLTMGTSTAMRVVVSPDHDIQLPMGLWCYYVDAQHAVIGGAMSEGGNLLTWMRNTSRIIGTLKEVEPLIAHIEPDSHGLTILPFLAGERSLGWHAEARMTIAGVSLHTSPPEMLRASMEALAYRISFLYQRLREALQAERSEHKIMGSGGALLGSNILKHIISDTLDATIYPSREQEASARGVALLALQSLKIIPDLQQLEPDVLEPTQPDTTSGDIYRRAAERQKHLYELLLSPQ